MEKESDSAVLLKDPSHVAAKEKLLKLRNSLPEVVRMLKETHQATVRLLTDEIGDRQAVYFQYKEMKKSFHCRPEIILIGTTYKLL